MLQQRARLIIIPGGGHDSDVHAFQFIDLGIINLGKNQLVMKTERVVATSVK